MNQPTPTDDNCKRMGHAWKCLRCGLSRDGVNPNDFWKDVLPHQLRSEERETND